MSEKLKKNAGFSLIPFAFLFLFDPSWSIIDPLPDFIGYVILCFALSNLGYISTRISEAITGFWKATVLSVARVGAIILISKIFGDSEQSVGSLVFVFIFAILELMIVIPAYKNLFEGLIWLGMMYEGEAISRQRKRGKLNATEKIYWLTTTFVIIKTIICSLPEFTSLISNSAYEFVVILRILAILIVAPVAIWWLIAIIRYCVSIKKDVKFIENVSNTYQERFKTTPQIFTVQNLCVGIGAIMLALVLSIDVYSDNINILHDALFFAALIVVAILIRKYSPRWKALAVTSSVGVIFSTASHYLNASFFENHSIGAIRRDEDAYYAYYRVLGVSAATAIVAVAAIILTGLILRDIYLSHGDIEKRTVRGRFNPDIPLVLFMTIGSLSSLSGVYRLWSLPFFYRGWIFYYSTVITAAINIAFVIYAWCFTGKIRESIKHKYRLYL
jgi:hypothetical protein